MDWATGVRSPTGAEEFSSNLCVRQALGPTQPPVQWVPGIFPRGRAKKYRSYTSSPPVCQNWRATVTFALFTLQYSVIGY
jgi:hypothetical protein